MRWLLALATAASLAAAPAQAAKEVFAHVILGNTNALTVTDWEADMKLAKASSIDAFVLNVAQGDQNNDVSLSNAFTAAKNAQFKLFFSFDYAASPNGAFDKAGVKALMDKFGGDEAYFKVKEQGNKPLVSTFEGPKNADDWTELKASTNCFFIPDWSSLGPAKAAAAAGGVVDGLFSFDAWPVGPTNKTTTTDKEYQAALSGKAFMMPVSPWFFTNLPTTLSKNWMWHSDGLWDTRWDQVMEVQPDFVEILTWNDYGESHYIKPITKKDEYDGLLKTFGAPLDYVTNNPHQGWLKFLPFYIAQYKAGGKVPAVAKEEAVLYYRTAPATACPNGGTTGNNPAFGQTAVPPEQMAEDSIFFAALLTSDADVKVTVTVGATQIPATFNKPPAAGAGTPGVYRGAVPMGTNTGAVSLTVTRGGTTVAEAKGGPELSTTCQNNVQNWNGVAV
ncbi:glycoside hydrolase family 71 protein [Podospora didyma]|uniref:Glycoside hydrolase family 71 protein n=1 Tax=Podospora didyma TaxID=330526 RepID=A0AAE0U747_9PEZI|nr:glycoside hydrolase family 71 protein [Podospora didyma]